MKSIPKTIPTDSPYVEVRGEVYMSNEAFEMVSELRPYVRQLDLLLSHSANPSTVQNN
jgi:NAD-dependent DNA ligase